jgi:16S rRNA (cytosine967-C5)-methyltransferase
VTLQTTGRLVEPTLFDVNNPVPALPTATVQRLEGVEWGAAAPFAVPTLAALARVLLDGRPAERELDALLRSCRDASAPARRALAESLLGVSLWRRRLAWHAGSETPSALWSCFLVAAGCPPEAAARLAGPTAPLILRPDAPTDLATSWSAPDWLAETLASELGQNGAADFLRAVSLPGPVTLRTNTLRTTRVDLARSLTDEGRTVQPTPFARDGLFVLSTRPNLYGLAASRGSLFEVQDEGSQLLGELLDAQPGDAVLDLCAGAGGKTLQPACHVGPRGTVHAFDVELERLSRLQHRAARAGAHQVRVHRGQLPPGLRADRVLVDAPCSELGALRRGPDARFRMDPATFARWPTLQLELLERGAAHLRPGGRLVYATCTLRREENEDVARAFEARQPGFRRQLPAWAAPFEHRGFFRALPQQHGTDGFFAAVYEAPQLPE